MSELEVVFRYQKVLSMAGIKEVVGTNSRMTAFRRLKALPYRSSYSHRGMFYTLDDIPEYDPYGVWMFHGVCFSRYRRQQRGAPPSVEIRPIPLHQ